MFTLSPSSQCASKSNKDCLLLNNIVFLTDNKYLNVMVCLLRKRFPFSFLHLCLLLILQSGLFAQDIDLSTLPKVTGDGIIERVIPTTDGKYIIIGTFDFIEGKPVSRIAKLNSDGSLDDTFSTSFGFDNTIYDVLVSDAGEVFLAMVTNVFEYRVVKLLSNGTVDDSFDFKANQAIYALAWHFGNVLVGGSFSEVNEKTVSKLVSVATDGILNTAINTNVAINFTINKIKKQGDKIILIERFGSSMARLNSDGTTDNSFEFDIDALNLALGSTSHEYDYFVVTNNQIIVFDLMEGILFFDNDGNFLDFTDNYKFLSAMVWRNDEVWFALRMSESEYDVYKYIPDIQNYEYLGSGNGPINDMTFNGSSNVVLGGSFSEFNATATSSLIKLDDENNPEPGFDIEEFYNNGAINAMAIQGENKILIGGRFTKVNGVNINNLARLNLDGTLDQSFTPFDTRFVDQIEVTADNKIYVDSYAFSSMDGTYVDGFHLLNADGSLDQTIYSGSIWDFATLGTQKILHNFQEVFVVEGGQPQSFIAGTPPTLVHSMAISNQGTLLVGAFYSAPGSSYAEVKSYLADGTEDPDFNEVVFTNTGNQNPTLGALQVGADGKIWVGGRFNRINGETSVSKALVRLNQDGTLDTSFNTGGTGLGASPLSTVDFINLMNDGSAIVTGRNFSTYNNAEVNKTFIVTSTGKLSDEILPINARGQVLTSVAIDNDQYLYGGYFNFSGEPIRTALGVLDLSEPEPEPEPPVTAVEDAEDHSLEIYPNPVRDYLTIKVSVQGFSALQFSIYSLTGQRVAEPYITSSGDLQVDVQALPSGMYVLRGIGRSGNFYRKLIKQ